MPAQVIHTIAASGGDYTSLAAWEAAQQRDLVAADEEAIAECEAFNDTQSLTIDGWTVDATRRVVVRAAAGAAAQMPWSASAYRMTANNVWAIDNYEDYTLVQGLQLENNLGGVGAQGAVKNRAVRMDVERCNLRSDGSGTMTGADQTVAGELRIRNSVIHGWSGHGVTCGAFTGGVVRVYSSTIVENGGRGINRAGDDSNNLLYVKNTLCAGNAGGDFAQSASAGTDYNATADATAIGANSRVSQTFTFVDAAGGDWHLAAGDAGARGHGTDLSADPDWPFSVDFDGETRAAPWDIGADQVAASGPTYLLECLPGSLALTGSTAALAHGRQLVALAGALSLTGAPADLRRSRLLQALPGGLAITGADAALTLGRLLEALAGSLVLTGQPAELTYTPAGTTYLLECLPGSLALAGSAATLAHHRVLTAQPGALALTGADAALRLGRRLEVQAGTLLLTGSPAELRLHRLLAGTAGSLLINGLPATLTWSGLVIAAPTDGPLRAVLLLPDARARLLTVPAEARWVQPPATAILS